MESNTLWKELFDLSGQVALVTGGTKGIGKEIALTLARAGANVAICSRNVEDPFTVAQEITDAAFRQIIGLSGDVSCTSDLEHLIETVTKELGPVDILVANAGTNIRKGIDDLTEEEWQYILDTNLKGAFLAAKSVLPEMRRRNYGRIVFLGSIHSFTSLPMYTAYASSKTALLGLTRVLALEYARSGICVNALCPGFIDTPLTRPLRDDPIRYQSILERIPLGRWGEPKDLRGIILFLCSPACSLMTGAALVIDGGWTAQ